MDQGMIHETPVARRLPPKGISMVIFLYSNLMAFYFSEWKKLKTWFQLPSNNSNIFCLGFFLGGGWCFVLFLNRKINNSGIETGTG